MTNSECLWLLRSLLADPQGERWTDTELYYFLSEAQRRISEEASIATLWNLTDIAETTLVAGQDGYALPDDFAYDRLVKYKGTPSTRKSHEDIRELVDTNSYVTPSETNPFHIIEEGKIRFFVGGVTQSGSEVFTLLFVRTPVDIDGSTDPELPEHFHNAIIDLAMQLAYESSDEPEAAEQQEAFGVEQIVTINARQHGRNPYGDIARDPRLSSLQEETQ
jgi:hypothetical protein